MKGRSLRPIAGWVFAIVVALAVIYVPANMLLFVVAMWGGFSASVSTPLKLLVLAAALSAIVGATFFLARTIKRAVLRN